MRLKRFKMNRPAIDKLKRFLAKLARDYLRSDSARIEEANARTIQQKLRHPQTTIPYGQDKLGTNSTAHKRQNLLSKSNHGFSGRSKFLIGSNNIFSDRTVLPFPKSFASRKEGLLGKGCTDGWALTLGAGVLWDRGACGSGSSGKNCAVGPGPEAEGLELGGSGCGIATEFSSNE